MKKLGKKREIMRFMGKFIGELGDVGAYCLNCDLWDLWIFRIGEASCVATLLYNAILCAGVRWLQMCECAAIAHIRKVSGLETPPTG